MPSALLRAAASASSRDANQLIADTYIVRTDLLQDKPEMMKAFVEAMAEASQLALTAELGAESEAAVADRGDHLGRRVA